MSTRCSSKTLSNFYFYRHSLTATNLQNLIAINLHFKIVVDNGLGGWSLNYWGEDLAVEKIAYVLYCDKEITFEDGTVWINPDFEEWLNTYEGKTIDVKVLENYYPYVQTIVF